jgi:hypothetical protein
MPKKKVLGPSRMPSEYHLFQNSDGYWTFYKGGFPSKEVQSMEYLTAESAINGAWTEVQQKEFDELNNS